MAGSMAQARGPRWHRVAGATAHSHQPRLAQASSAQQALGGLEGLTGQHPARFGVSGSRSGTQVGTWGCHCSHGTAAQVLTTVVAQAGSASGTLVALLENRH